MKKLFAMFVLMLVAACGADENMVDIYGVQCEFVGDGGNSQLVKCPMTPGLVAIQSEEPNAMFMDGDYAGVNIAEYAKDKSVVWVNIVESDCDENTKGYRFLISEPVFDGVQMHAVLRCI